LGTGHFNHDKEKQRTSKKEPRNVFQPLKMGTISRATFDMGGDK
jgi:hypothetical protein